MMEIKPVRALLEIAGLNAPSLNVLVPNEDNYKTLILQPSGQIEANADGVRNRDRELAEEQYGKFLDDALNSRADLVVTPEYSMPWSVLTNAIKSNKSPARGKLWAFGCESIRYNELEVLQQELDSIAIVLFEEIDADPARFVSPLAYLFKTELTEDIDQIKNVLIVQFKTHPMGDPNHFEINGMQKGKFIYKFGNENSLKLVSLICADVFNFLDSHAQEIYDRALIVHIQLNQEPRHEKFLDCRRKLLSLSGDATEILSLNWARDVHLWLGEELKWKNIAGSAWYLKSKEFDDKDTTLCENHRRGLYYTRLTTLRSHALFFNFEPASYLLEVTKVAHIGVGGAISRRRGPQLKKVCFWDSTTGLWVEQEAIDDGFSAIVEKCGNAKNEIKTIANSNPFAAERILALSSGCISSEENWYKIELIDSCRTDASETIYRITFCQDTNEQAVDFRTGRLKRFGRLWGIIHNENNLLQPIKDLKDNIRFEWSPSHPHQNAVTKEGKRATLVYMGEESEIGQIEATKKKLREYIRRAFPDENQRLSAQQRIIVWFRNDDDEIVPFEPHDHLKIDQTSTASEFDIGREG
jgi:hypothetical protein